MPEGRGLCLASTWYRKASLADTSPRTMRGIGQHDNLPVCNRNLQEAEPYTPMDAVLHWQPDTFVPCSQAAGALSRKLIKLSSGKGAQCPCPN